MAIPQIHRHPIGGIVHCLFAVQKRMVDRGARALSRSIVVLCVLFGAAPGVHAGVCEDVLQCTLDTAQNQLPVSVCDSCSGGGLAAYNAIKGLIDNPTITSACGAANEINWLRQAITGGAESALTLTLCQVLGPSEGLDRHCDNGCVLSRCGDPLAGTIARILNNLPPDPEADKQAKTQFEGCQVTCGCGLNKLVCEEGTKRMASAMCKALAIADQDKAPLSATESLHQTLSGKHFILKNRHTSEYVVSNRAYGTSGNAFVTKNATPSGSLWQFEDASGGFTFIRSTITGQYLTIRNGTIATSFPSTESAKWKVIPVAAINGFFQIQNKEKTSFSLHNQNGKLEAGSIQLGWFSAHWALATLDSETAPSAAAKP